MSPLRLTRQFDVPRAASDPGRVCAKASEKLVLEVAGHEVAISYRSRPAPDLWLDDTAYLAERSREPADGRVRFCGPSLRDRFPSLFA